MSSKDNIVMCFAMRVMGAFFSSGVYFNVTFYLDNKLHFSMYLHVQLSLEVCHKRR